jgi:hypothetical protein
MLIPDLFAFDVNCINIYPEAYQPARCVARRWRLERKTPRSMG